MNFRRHSGLFLVLAGACVLFWLSGSSSMPARIIALIGTVLFILAFPAVHAFQPGGPIGLAGLLLVELAAVIALGFEIRLLTSSSHASWFALAGASAGMLGRLVIGWITARRKIFPAWVGWAFLLEGLLNFTGGLLHFPFIASVFPVLVVLLGSAALFVYGLTIFLRQEG
jgi:hypothetical protein